ncbi:hypothetical protein DER46DRAFT_567063 [Fusarium sp. MPI-SDFR-AT-0072]|nr:hypothetical protein DER46DRAFT_567063 [Fusarium sp. MPI-SDFR-AT-0072]
MTTFFGENDGRYITQMSAIGTGIFDWYHIISLRFEFMDESIERCLGDVDYEIMDSDRVPLRFADHGNTNGLFQIDGATGEEIASFEVQMDGNVVVGLKMESPKRILVTGGSGFLGGHIVRQLLEDAVTAVAIVSRHPKMPADAADGSRVSLHAADLTIPSQIEQVFETFNPHAVIHTASPSYLDTPANLMKANIDGTKELLKAASACADTCAFVFTSSDSAVIPTQEPLSEDDAVLYDETNAPNVYAMTKAAAERLVLASDSEQLRTAAIRIPATYGEYDTNFVPQLVQSIRRKEHKMQVGNDTKVFEFLYVKKASEAHILAMRALLDLETRDKAGGQVFFISDEKPQKFFDFSRKFYAAAGHPVALEEVTKIPFPVMQAMASTAEWVYWILTLGYIKPDSGCRWSLEKAKRILGYEPVADQDEAIRKTMEWAMKTF